MATPTTWGYRVKHNAETCDCDNCEERRFVESQPPHVGHVFTGFATREAAADSLKAFHNGTEPAVLRMDSRPLTRALSSGWVTECYVIWPDHSGGYEHTIDGINWIPRENSVL